MFYFRFGVSGSRKVKLVRLLGKLRSPTDIDWVIIRENSEGEYAGHGGRAHRGHPEEVGTETAIFTRAGVSRNRSTSASVNP